jgi:AraC-like DNA-binding protein
MERLRLPTDAVEDDIDDGASIVSLASPMGIEFALVSAGPQIIEGRNPDQPAAVWLAILLEGEAKLSDGQSTVRIATGDIMFGSTGVAASLSLETRFRLLFITAPRVALAPRLIVRRPLRVGRLAGGAGLNHVFAGLLRSVAETLGDLGSDELRPVELAVTEFLVACLSDDLPDMRGAQAMRRAQLHRVQQTIERLLAEPGLDLAQVAQAEGVSTRYLQKLFKSEGENFTHYLRLRRLERCRLDLINARYSDHSISSICFRWGFNGSPHFSRAFRDAYGTTPREYRRRRLAELAEDQTPGSES